MLLLVVRELGFLGHDLAVRGEVRAIDRADRDPAVGHDEDARDRRELATFRPKDDLVGRGAAEALLARVQPVEPDEAQPARRAAEAALPFGPRLLDGAAIGRRAIRIDLGHVQRPAMAMG